MSNGNGDSTGGIEIGIENVGPLGLPLPTITRPGVDGSGPDPDPDTGVEDALDEAVSHGEGYIDAVEEAIREEDCEFCVSVLKDLRGRPADDQLQGLRELRELKREINTGEIPNKEELAEIMEDFEFVELPGV